MRRLSHLFFNIYMIEFTTWVERSTCYTRDTVKRRIVAMSVFRAQLKTFLVTSYNACNSGHGAFAASFEFAPYK